MCALKGAHPQRLKRNPGITNFIQSLKSYRPSSTFNYNILGFVSLTRLGQLCVGHLGLCEIKVWELDHSIQAGCPDVSQLRGAQAAGLKPSSMAQRSCRLSIVTSVSTPSRCALHATDRPRPSLYDLPGRQHPSKAAEGLDGLPMSV